MFEITEGEILTRDILTKEEFAKIPIFVGGARLYIDLKNILKEQTVEGETSEMFTDRNGYLKITVSKSFDFTSFMKASQLNEIPFVKWDIVSK